MHNQITAGKAPQRYAVAVSTPSGEHMRARRCTLSALARLMSRPWTSMRRCHTDQAVHGGTGFSDRLVGTISVFYFALLTGRAFQVCSACCLAPCDPA